MLAVILTGGKQYLVSPGDKIKIEKINAAPDNEFVFDKVLLKSNGDGLEIGRPYLEGAAVKARVLREGREDKKIVFRYHSKTRYRKKKGHRQHFTEVEILEIK
jgi:large subunit ribosomal protein L21